MINKKSYVFLETPSPEKEYYYCLTDDTVYEYAVDGLLYRKPKSFIAIMVVLVIIISFIIDLGMSSPSKTINMGVSLSVCLLIVLGCITDYCKRRRKTFFVKSENTISSFSGYISLIKYKFHKQKVAIIFSLTIIILSTFLHEPMLSLPLAAFGVLMLYQFVVVIGGLHKSKIIKLLEKEDH